MSMNHDAEIYYEERDRLRLAAVECGVPSHTIDPLLRYIMDGLEPGGFLMAVLSNDLMEACGRADEMNGRYLKAICTFLYNYAPSECKGSPERVGQWLDSFRQQFETPRQAIDAAMREERKG